MIASPPVQPSASITSGTGSVSTMWLEETVRRLRSRCSCPEAALTATTAVAARTRPPAVSATMAPGASGCAWSARSARTAERSKIRTPRPSRRSRSPKASRAGWTVAPARVATPPRNTGESQTARVSAAVRGTTSSPLTAPALAPSWPGAQETTRCGAARCHASTSWASHQAPIASTDSTEARHSSSAAASPCSPRSSGRYSHSEDRKPPLRPLGPIPQRSASSTTTRAFGSVSAISHAVHIPV